MNISPISYRPVVKTTTNKAKSFNNSPSFRATWEDFNKEPNIVYLANEKKLNILGGSDQHLRHIGEVLRTTPNDLILCKFSSQTSMFGYINTEKAKRAYDRLMPYVMSARNKYQKNEDEIALIKSQPTQTDYTRQRSAICLKERERMDRVANTAMDYMERIDISSDDREEEDYSHKLYGGL